MPKKSSGQQDHQLKAQPTKGENSSTLGHVEEVENLPLTDEELALKLQKEWNDETAGEMDIPVPRISMQRPVATSTIAEADKSKALSLTEAPVTPIKKATLSLQSSSTLLNTATIKVPFDENPLTFDPLLYLPAFRKEWENYGGATSYGLLVRCFVLVNSTQSRIKIVDTLVNLLRTIIEGDPKSLQPAVGSISLLREIVLM